MFRCDSNSQTPDYKSGPLPLLYFTQGNFAEKKLVISLTLIDFSDTIELKPCEASKF